MFNRYSTQFASQMDIAQTLNGVLLTMQLWPEYERKIGIMALDAVAAGHGVDVHDAPQVPCFVVAKNDTTWCG